MVGTEQMDREKRGRDDRDDGRHRGPTLGRPRVQEEWNDDRVEDDVDKWERKRPRFDEPWRDDWDLRVGSWKSPSEQSRMREVMEIRSSREMAYKTWNDNFKFLNDVSIGMRARWRRFAPTVLDFISDRTMRRFGEVKEGVAKRAIDSLLDRPQAGIARMGRQINEALLDALDRELSRPGYREHRGEGPPSAKPSDPVEVSSPVDAREVKPFVESDAAETSPVTPTDAAPNGGIAMKNSLGKLAELVARVEKVREKIGQSEETEILPMEGLARLIAREHLLAKEKRERAWQGDLAVGVKGDNFEAAGFWIDQSRSQPRPRMSDSSLPPSGMALTRKVTFENLQERVGPNTPALCLYPKYDAEKPENAVTFKKIVSSLQNAEKAAIGIYTAGSEEYRFALVPISEFAMNVLCIPQKYLVMDNVAFGIPHSSRRPPRDPNTANPSP